MKKKKIFFILIGINVLIAIGLLIHLGVNIGLVIDVVATVTAKTIMEAQILGLVFYQHEEA